MRSDSKRSERECPKCGVMFFPYKGSQMFCSRQCSNGSRQRGLNRTCIVCGKKFSAAPSRNKNYCGRECMGQAYTQRTGRSGPRYVSGRIVGPGGYIMLLQPLEARPPKYKMEHRLVMEGILSRPMESHETVHHIDGDRANNAPENLELRTGKHGKGATKHCPTCTCHL